MNSFENFEFLFLKHYSYELVVCFTVLSFLFSILLTNSISEKDVFSFINKNQDDYEFRRKVIRLVEPDVGDVVRIKYSPWKDYWGYVTKSNDYTCNVKITKSLNGDTNYIPKRRLKNRFKDEVELC